MLGLYRGRFPNGTGLLLVARGQVVPNLSGAGLLLDPPPTHGLSTLSVHEECLFPRKLEEGCLVYNVAPYQRKRITAGVQAGASSSPSSAPLDLIAIPRC